MENYGLFQNQPVANTASKVEVNLGGTGDCGFRAIAARIVMEPSVVSPKVLSMILKEYSACFTKFEFDASHPVAQMQKLRQKTKDTQFIVELAYVLRQIAVDTMLQNPSRYQGAFVNGHNEGVSPAYMRKQNTWIDESAIAALSDKLETPVSVQVMGVTDQSLPLCIDYGVSSSFEQDLDPITIRLRSGHYTALLPKHVSSLPLLQQKVAIDPAYRAVQQDPPLDVILARIAADNAKMKAQYANVRSKLETMVGAGELTQPQLISFYKQAMEASDYLQGHVRYIGTELGSEAFAKRLELDDNGMTRHSAKHQSNDDDIGLGSLVIHALSTDVAIGHIPQADLFDHLDDDNAIELSSK